MVNGNRVLPLLLLASAVRCMPDIDALSSAFGEPAGRGGSSVAGGGSGNDAGTSSGKGGKGGKAGGGSGGVPSDGGQDTMGGEAGVNAEGGTSGESGTGGEAGTGNTGAVGEGGAGGESGSTAGKGGKGGTGGAGNGGTGGAGNGGAGTGGTGGNGGMGPVGCIDGCIDLYIPFSATGQTQFFTFPLNGIDLSTSVITANVRTVNYAGTSGHVKLYASSPTFVYFGGPDSGPALSAIQTPTTLSLSLTSTGSWDNTNVGYFGIQVYNDGSASAAIPIHILVEDITISNSTVGPFLFQEDDEGWEPNPYQAVEGVSLTWVPPDP